MRTSTFRQFLLASVFAVSLPTAFAVADEDSNRRSGRARQENHVNRTIYFRSHRAEGQDR